MGSAANGKSSRRRRWRWASKNIHFGDKPLSFSGKAPDWSKIGVLVPLVVAAHMIAGVCSSLPDPVVISVYVCCPIGAHGLVVSVRRRSQRSKTFVYAMVSSLAALVTMGATMLGIYSGAAPTGTAYGFAALASSVTWNLIREIPVRTWPDTTR